MTCEELLMALSEHVSGTLEPGVCDGFAEHLAGCNPCQVVVDNVRQTIELYKAGEPYPVPEAFKKRLRTALRARWAASFPGPQGE